MQQKLLGRTLNTGVQRPLRLEHLNKAAHEAAKVATPPENIQYDADVETLGGDSVCHYDRERFKRLIRLPLRNDYGTMGRRLLVTGGATVPFVGLLEEVTDVEFLQALRTHGFTHVYLQCGPAHDQIEARLKSDGRGSGLEIETFAFCRDLKSLFKEHCRGEKGVQPAGVIMGHAGQFVSTKVQEDDNPRLTVYPGTGTIGDALEVDCALVIVANTTLMDDHQSAFAAEMAAEHPTIVQGQLG
jgi:beta-1,4-N-acetylglucosaminyltransferase